MFIQPLCHLVTSLNFYFVLLLAMVKGFKMDWKYIEIKSDVDTFKLSGVRTDDQRLVHLKRRYPLLRNPEGETCGEGWWTSTGSFCVNASNIRNHNFLPYLCANLECIMVDKDVLDLGTGYGYLGRCMLRLKEHMLIETGNGRQVEDDDFFRQMNWTELWDEPRVIRSWDGYDGAANIANITNGFVKYFDLTVPRFLGRTFDWVTAFEVAEHIPPQYEMVFLHNLARHACEGIVLSWATPDYSGGPPGGAHPNPKFNRQVHKMMAKIGFEWNRVLEFIVRRQLEYDFAPVYKNHTMVFKRKYPLHDCKNRNY